MLGVLMCHAKARTREGGGGKNSDFPDLTLMVLGSSKIRGVGRGALLLISGFVNDPSWLICFPKMKGHGSKKGQ